MKRFQKTPKRSGGWNLVPLTPEYIEEEHGPYAESLLSALEKKEIRNIALSGHYGVGKSSILKEVARRHEKHVIEISLSTLAPLESTQLDDSVPKQAVTPTNRIQQEIVKQLLYQNPPHRARASRFRRIELFSWRREFLVAVITGFVLTLLFLLNGWTTILTDQLPALKNLVPYTIHLAIWATASAFSLASLRLLYGRLYIKQLSAGAATVTLDDESVSYFDQYLDEIVHFFEISNSDVVIFEDIDRFNDSHIFETLRALNTLLNSSPHTESPIRFIYAIKDSIFEAIATSTNITVDDNSKVDAPTETHYVRANRTKFFDLVIPVVPFITHRSARDHALRLLKDIAGSKKPEVRPELLDLACRYVADMRMLKNACNEFVVFRDRILLASGNALRLNETELFAMMLYKGRHLSDFEAIRINKSNLDKLYDATRHLVDQNIDMVQMEQRRLRALLSKLDGAADRSQTLGVNLKNYVFRVARHTSPDRNISDKIAYSFNGAEAEICDPTQPDFWRAFLGQDGRLTAVVGDHYRTISLTFTRADLAEALGDPLELDQWEEGLREKLQERLTQMSKKLTFLKQADMAELIRNDEFRFAPECDQDNDRANESLHTIATKILNDDLAYHLVRKGYIGQGFFLYTSVFQGERVSAVATNFIHQHVDRDRMDFHFQLAPDDVDAVLRERPSLIGSTVLYNITILDRVLQIDQEAASKFVMSLKELGYDQEQFLQAYLNEEGQQATFVKRFSQASRRAFTYLIDSVDLDDQKRLDFVNIALESLVDRFDYEIDEGVTSYFLNNYTTLHVLQNNRISFKKADRVAKFFLRAGVQVPSLEPLSHPLRRRFVTMDLYAINVENLRIALGEETILALDVVRGRSEDVYTYMLDNLASYLAAIEGISPTVEVADKFGEIIGDVLARDPDHLEDIIARANSSCIIEDIRHAPKEAWILLARHRRVPSTFQTIMTYVQQIGSIDPAMGGLLSESRKITEFEEFDEDSKSGLAYTVLEARDSLKEPGLRVDIVTGLELKEYLEVDRLHPENGDLFALLVEANVIADDEISYAHLSETKWPTRECFLEVSKEARKFLRAELVRKDVANILSSHRVPKDVKLAVVRMANELTEELGTTDCVELAKFAAESKEELPLEVVVRLAESEASPVHVIDLLEPHLTSLIRDGQLPEILGAIGGVYAGLAEPGWEAPKIPDTPSHVSLLKALKETGVVSSAKQKGKFWKVHKRRSTPPD